MENQQEFTVITIAEEPTSRGFSPGKKIKEKISLSSEEFAKNLNLFLEGLNRILLQQPESIGYGLKIDEIELKLAINASGGFELIGKVEMGMEGAITIKLKRG